MHLGRAPVLGSRPFFTDCTITLDYNQQRVSLRDGMGHTQKPIPLTENGRVFQVFYNQNLTFARSCGHLLLVSTGTKISALDPWKASGNPPSPTERRARGEGILWGQDLTDTANDNGET